jgi:hypothetical protein
MQIGGKQGVNFLRKKTSPKINLSMSSYLIMG